MRAAACDVRPAKCGGYEFQGPTYSLAQYHPLRKEAAGALDVPLDDEPETILGHGNDSRMLILGRRVTTPLKRR